MSIVDADKIFIDPKEEITSVVDSLLKKDKEKVVIVVPQNSLILSSFITLKVLYREVIKSKKIAVIVTEDQYGLNIAQKAGFVSVAKVSQITDELWDIAFSKKYKALEVLRGKTEAGAEEKLTAISQPSFAEASAGKQPTDIVEPIDLSVEEGITDIPQVEESVTDIPQEEPQIPEENVAINDKSPKIIEVDGVEIMVGGDIGLTHKNLGNAKMVGDYLNSNNMEHKDRQLVMPLSGGNFTGKDFTRYPKKDGFLSRFFKPKSPKRRSTDLLETEDLFEKEKKRKKLIKGVLIALAFVVLLFTIGGLVIVNYSSVDVFIKVKPEGIKELGPVEVTGSLTETQLNIENKMIPVVQYNVENVSASKTGEANGVGKRGTKAKGLVTIYNTYTEPEPTAIHLPVGTKIKNIGTDLYFVLTTEVNLAAPTKNSSNVYDTPISEDIPVEAIDIGTDYNLDSAGSTNNFLVDGYESSKVRVTKFTSFSGGTMETFVSVSQENIDNLKKTILPDLQKQAESRITNLVPQGFIIISNSFKITEEKDDALPLLGDEAKDKTFNLNISLKAYGYAVREDYINNLAKSLLLAQKADKENIDIEEIKETTITFVSADADKMLLNLTSKGTFKNLLDQAALKNGIVGQSIEDAKAFFKTNSDIAESRITYTPFFIPLFLQRIPNSVNRITINIQ